MADDTITSLQKDITDLQTEKIQYQNMNTKIGNAINNLSKAKRFLNDFRTQFKNNYRSNTANVKVAEIYAEITNINNIITLLNNTILVASNNKINAINNQITKNKATIDELNK